MRLHETAVNNYTSALLGGATLSETKAGEGTKADVKLPKVLKDAWKNRMDEKANQAGGCRLRAVVAHVPSRSADHGRLRRRQGSIDAPRRSISSRATMNRSIAGMSPPPTRRSLPTAA